MSAFKQFLAKDIKVVPFTVNKEFTLNNSEFYTSSADAGTYKEYVGIDRFLGKNLSGSVFEITTEPTTGTINTHYQRTIYNSVKELYYSNFLTSSWGDPSSANLQRNISGSIHTPNYYNYLSSTLTASRYFPTGSEEKVTVISIPSKLYGEYIQPSSFEFKYTDSSSAVLQILDDGEGNLYSSSSYAFYSESVFTTTVEAIYSSLQDEPDPTGAPNSFLRLNFLNPITIPSGYQLTQVNYNPEGNTAFVSGGLGVGGTTLGVLSGEILNYVDINSNYITTGEPGQFYFTSSNNPNPGAPPPVGADTIILTYTSTSFDESGSLEANEKIGNIIYEHGMAIITNQSAPLQGLTIQTDTTCSFKSSTTIYETQYKCTARESEFNLTLNPSIIKNDSTGSLYDYSTGSFFSPYITTIGLYDDNQNLLAVGKLSQPVQSSPTTDTTILVNLDL